MPTLKQLRIFVKVAEEAHMGEAAMALGLTQPALSQQLRLLEDQLCLKLFERVPKGMQISPSGRELLPGARAVLNALHEFGDAADQAAQRPVGTVRFGVTPTIGPYLMPGVISRLHREFPALRIFIREGIPSAQHAELSAGELDMVLSPLPIEGTRLHVEPLFREPLRIVAPPDDPLLSRKTLAKKDFAGRTFLTLDHRHHYHEQISAIAGKLDAEILADYEGTSLDALQQMVGSGVGLAVLPEIYVRSGAGGLDVVKIAEPDGWAEYRSIGASWREQAAFSSVYRDIAQIIAEEARARLGD
jgi:LysR family hydrogen peroxide-inducible transcriptional activator